MTLSDNINLLGSLLGEVISEHAGKDIFNIVERLRKTSKELRKKTSLIEHSEIANIIQDLDTCTLASVIKAFTVYFHLVNEAEKIEIIKVNKERELVSTYDKPKKESILEAIHSMKLEGMTTEELQTIIKNLNIEPVFTAHPTEAKKLDVISALNRISLLIFNYQMKELTLKEKKDLIAEIKRQMTLLWLTDELRYVLPTVQEEAESILYFLGKTFFPLIATLHTDLKYALDLYYPNCQFNIPPILKGGSWVGGDRDGNPNVSLETTKNIMILQASTILKKYIEQIKVLIDELSIVIDASEELISSIQEDLKVINLDTKIKELYKNEPFRIKFLLIEEKLKNTLIDIEVTSKTSKDVIYNNPSDFLKDLNLVTKSLIKSNVSVIVNSGTLANLILQVKTFGFHFVELDIRQHSDEHETVVDEILSYAGSLSHSYKKLSEPQKIKLLTELLIKPQNIDSKSIKLSDNSKKVFEVFKLIKDMHQRISADCIRCYIISFTHEVSDLLEVLFLAKEAELIKILLENGEIIVKSEIDIVPLFETLEDLRGAPLLLENLFTNLIYSKQLHSRNNFQEIMLGYSDSNKDSGYLAANIGLFNAQINMIDVCKKHNIKWRFFHGRGGSIGRGGGQAGKAIQALPYSSVGGQFRFTEQGEVLSSRYSLAELAHRHLETISNAILLVSSRKKNSLKDFDQEWLKIISSLAEISCRHYRKLVYEDIDFWNFYTQLTPIQFISQLRIGSRPTSRLNIGRIEDLRAIPWVFSWTQTRIMLPTWYGVGTALNEIGIHDNRFDSLQKMYNNWSFFRTLINNCQTALAKADMNTASQYVAFVEPATLGERIFGNIIKEYELTCKMILEITNQEQLLEIAPVIQKSISLRNPYTDPLNYIQVELLRRLKQSNEKINELNPAILASINGVAAAMQETG